MIASATYVEVRLAFHEQASWDKWDSRFLAKVEFSADGCWDWCGWVAPNGYGQVRLMKKLYYAHRLSYLAFVGEIPAGLDLDHLCRNRRCVNPYHLEPVTRKENLDRGLNYRGRRRSLQAIA